MREASGRQRIRERKGCPQPGEEHIDVLEQQSTKFFLFSNLQIASIILTPI